jgi:CMP-N,N'-diacetyllegionaminic acid synthase
MDMRILGLITARGGSKGVPGKNLAMLGDKSLLAWTIDAALSSGALYRTMVSTDNPAIAAAGRDAGAEIPFLRPAALATDDASTGDVVRHALNWMTEHEEGVPDYVAVLQPTSPFRSGADIANAVDLAVGRRADVVISVTRMHGHPSWILVLDPERRLRPWSGLDVAEQRQDRHEPYMPNGAVFVVRSDVALSEKSWYEVGALGYEMPPERSIDIDTPWDLRLARLLVKDM